MAEQTQPQAAVSQEAPSIESRMSAYLAQSEDPAPEVATAQEPETPAQQEQPTGPAETDEVTPDDIPEETEPAAQPAVDAFEIEIVHDGHQVKLNREDTIKYARQGFDYTQKTQALAAKDRQVSDHLQRLAQVNQVAPQLQAQLATVKALEAQLEPYKGVNWVQEAAADPGRYAQLRAQYDVLRETYGQAIGQYQQMDVAVKQQLQQVQAQRIQAESQRLPELVPEWKDPAKLESSKANISKHFTTAYGIDPKELDAGTDTAFKMMVLEKAMRYDKLVASKADKSKTLRQAPPVTVPGAAQSTTAKADKEKQLHARLKKTGTREDAMAVLLNRL